MCVLIVPVMTSWTSADTSCESNRNGRLAVLDTAEKMALIPATGMYWVGATRDEDGSPHFSWLTSERVSPQPIQNTGGEMCMSGNAGGFYDYPCTNDLHYICELYTDML
ncbi:hypothetical protein KP79_PYT20106 [Mizuhopecten yessoensis]|uniref:C-type lectin domain-containing protein n=1 Tax=Mizuhopecten yessoensis TaxID=6573 RepID=A0A210QU14_MIZYE|nr:hypothetical protein KP79_PYT20106 [Mizuhopecten yessoensis]